MSKVWLWGDIHGGHKNITKYRTQFESEEHHFQTIKENHHKVVAKNDVVFFLGDTAFTYDRLSDIGSWVSAKKILIVGNHDCEKVNMRITCQFFDEVHGLYKYKKAWFSHAPIHPDELRGRLNLHGHMHNAFIDDPRYMNCCPEHTDYFPVLYQNAIAKMPPTEKG